MSWRQLGVSLQYSVLAVDNVLALRSALAANSILAEYSILAGISNFAVYSVLAVESILEVYRVPAVILHPGSRGAEGEWDSTNARLLLNYAQERNYSHIR